MTLHITGHAISRYRERVEPVDYATAHTRLQCPAVEAAADFGAPFVRLPGGQRIVLKGHTVVTVLPPTAAALLFHHDTHERMIA